MARLDIPHESGKYELGTSDCTPVQIFFFNVDSFICSSDGLDRREVLVSETLLENNLQVGIKQNNIKVLFCLDLRMILIVYYLCLQLYQ